MRRAIWVCVFLAVLSPTAAVGHVPQTMSYQGVLKDDMGAVVADENYDFTFRIYDVETNGTALLTEIQTIYVSGGILNAVLGEVTPLTLDFNEQYWLGVTIGEGSELSPRTKLTGAPYALNAKGVFGTHNEFPDSGKVGIGTTGPSYPLHVVADDLHGIRLDGTALGSWSLLGINAAGTNSSPGIEYLKTGALKAMTYVGASDNWHLRVGATDVLTAESGTYNIGIDKMDPEEKLDVGGAVRVGNTANTNAGTIRWSGTDFEGYDGGTWLSLTGGGSGSLPPGTLGQTIRHNGGGWVASDLIYNDGSKVGIGTTSPLANMEVVGDNIGYHFRLSAPTGVGPALYLNAENKDWVIYGTNPAAGAGDRKFVIRDYSAATDRLVIDENGHVGIDEQNPDAPLHIAGGNGDLTSTEGDLKIGDDTYRLKMGVATSGGEVGTARIRVQGGLRTLRLGVDTDDMLSLRPYGDIDMGCSTRTAYLHLLHEGWVDPAVYIFSNGVGGAIQMLDESGGRLVSLMGNPNDYGGSLILWSDNVSPGILVDANADGAGNPEMYIQGSSNTAVFSMYKDNDSTVILPVSSISAIEMFNEPGVASDTEGASSVDLDGTVQTLLSRTVNLPAEGYVQVIGTCQGMAVHTNGTASSAGFGVSQSSTTFPVNQDVGWGIPGTAASGNYGVPITVHGLFYVPSSGSTTFYFLAQEESGSISVYDMQLTLMYVPSPYGIVTPTTLSAENVPDAEAPMVPGKSESEIAAERAESEAANQARIDREFEQMRAEIAELKQALRRREADK
ncbi:MAG: hypothetical protein AMJ46_03955 [Latescibacteria bacterium DG_63]|nr:MAG: hypothetical protein AMJ46_03955 [Latescibacteria bacterium DG_63]